MEQDTDEQFASLQRQFGGDEVVRIEETEIDAEDYVNAPKAVTGRSLLDEVGVAIDALGDKAAREAGMKVVVGVDRYLLELGGSSCQVSRYSIQIAVRFQGSSRRNKLKICLYINICQNTRICEN